MFSTQQDTDQQLLTNYFSMTYRGSIAVIKEIITIRDKYLIREK